jgi:hypothetical protein
VRPTRRAVGGRVRNVPQVKKDAGERRTVSVRITLSLYNTHVIKIHDRMI